MSRFQRQRTLGLAVFTLCLLSGLLAAGRSGARPPGAQPEKQGAQVEEEKAISPDERQHLRARLEQGFLPDWPLTPVQVRQVLGPPSAIAREIVFQRYLEQWHYAQPGLRLMFDHRRGQKTRLQGVQRIAPAAP